MSRAEKRAPILQDPALVESERRRVKELSNSSAYQRGIAQAKETNIRNVREALSAELANLKRHTPSRDETAPGRDRYDRTYRRAVQAAERLALATGEAVSGFPAYLPQPAPTVENSVTIAVPGADPNALLTPQGKVAKPAGLGRSGKGGPAPGEAGTDANNAWLNVQGAG